MRFSARWRALGTALVAVMATATLMGPAATPAHAASSAFPKENAVLRTAKGLIGSPYAYGGTSPGGFDCSGFTMYVYARHGLSLPHSSGAQYALGDSKGYQRIGDMDHLRPGDLVFHGSPGAIQHAGIYIGGDRFISSTSSEGVQIRSMHDGYWGPIYVGGVRTPLAAGDEREGGKRAARDADPKLLL